MQQYEVRWYATFWDERNQQLDRVTLGPGKIPIPLDAMYMTTDAEIKSQPYEVVHMSPLTGQFVMPCCGRTPFEVPCTERITLEAALVTCKGNPATGGERPF